MDFNISKNVKIESSRKSFAKYCRKYVDLENVSELVKEEIIEDIKSVIDKAQNLEKLYQISKLPKYTVPEEKIQEISNEISRKLENTKYAENVNIEKIVEIVTNKRLQELRIKIIEKIVHIQRVSIVSQKIAETENLSDQDIKLAGKIGLLHDIGRFEQLRVYNHFNDAKSMDHGKYSVEVLFNKDEKGNMLIENFSEEKDYEIIKKALELHNKDLSILNEAELSSRERLHCKLIRDADKLDIYRVVTEGDNLRQMSGKELLKTPYITDNIYNKFVNDNVMLYREMSTGMDQLVAKFGFAFDINFEKSGKLIIDGGYLDKVYNLGIEYIKDEETMKRFTEMYEISKNNLVKGKETQTQIQETKNKELQETQAKYGLLIRVFNKIRNLFNEDSKNKKEVIKVEKVVKKVENNKKFKSKYEVSDENFSQRKNSIGKEESEIKECSTYEELDDDNTK